MVTLLVATTGDPASINPANKLLALSPGLWIPGIPLEGLKTFSIRNVRMVHLNGSIVGEDYLDSRWKAHTGEHVKEIIFMSKHTAATGKPALTVHPIGVPHLEAHETPLAGGKPGWAAPPCPRIGPWLRLLREVAEAHHLLPEFEITLEATHHGPVVEAPTMFVEIGSTEEYWGREDAAEAIAMVFWKGLGLDGGAGVGTWSDAQKGDKVLFGLGGGHYVPRHMDVIWKAANGAWVGHLLSSYSLPMKEPKPTNGDDDDDVGGTWKQAIRESFNKTQLGFPEGQIIAHLDSKSFKAWQRNAVLAFLSQERIPVAKPHEFILKPKV